MNKSSIAHEKENGLLMRHTVNVSHILLTTFKYPKAGNTTRMLTFSVIVCDEPEVPEGSYVVGYDFNIHSKIEYHCEEGFELRGDALRTCIGEGESGWSGTPPRCECRKYVLIFL